MHHRVDKNVGNARDRVANFKIFERHTLKILHTKNILKGISAVFKFPADESQNTRHLLYSIKTKLNKDNYCSTTAAFVHIVILHALQVFT
jgi:hypothetical protein